MSSLKFCFVSAILVMILAPAYASVENILQVENITSVSAIVNPVTSNLAKSVKAAPDWKNFIQPQAFWSPDGSKLLIKSSIRWYKGEDKTPLIQDSSNGQPSPELTLTATPRITESIITTPKVPGFGAMLATGILYTIYLFKRRYN